MLPASVLQTPSVMLYSVMDFLVPCIPVFGTRLSVGEINSTNDGGVVKDGWVIHRSNLTSLTLEPGDIVRTGVSDSYGHSAIIRQVNSNGTFKVAECWGGDTSGCQLAWNNYNGDATTYPNASALLGAARWVLKSSERQFTYSSDSNETLTKSLM